MTDDKKPPPIPLRPDEARALTDLRCALRKLAGLYEDYNYPFLAEQTRVTMDVLTGRHLYFLERAARDEAKRINRNTRNASS